MSNNPPSLSSRRLRAAGLTATIAVGALALLLPGHSRSSTGSISPPPPAAACNTGPLSVGDALINTPTGGDTDFFSIPPGPPNIMFLLGNNDTMQDFIWPLPNGGATTGCDLANAEINGTTLPPPPTPVPANFNPILKFYKPTSTDPRENGTVAIDPDPDFQGSIIQFFDPGKFYTSNSNRLRLGSSLDNNFRATVGDTTADLACQRFMATTNGNYNTCRACLNDPSKGWYRWTSSGGVHRWILSGKILNVLPPKFVAARKVVKEVVKTVANVRLGITTFGPDRGWYDPPTLLHPVKPNCDKAFPILDQNDLSTARNDIIHQINLMPFENDERSIGEALFGIGAYFSSQKQDSKWSNWFNPPSGPLGYPGSLGWSDGAGMWVNGNPIESGGQQMSVCWACQSTAVIVVSDGIPLHDNSVPESKMMQLLIAKGARHPDGSPVKFIPGVNTNPAFDPGGINYCDKFGVSKTYCDYDAFPSGPDTNNLNYMDDVAFFLAHMDLRNDYNGDEGLDNGQRVRTYTIGFGDNSPMLKSIAYAGDGKFYTASNPDQLRDAITRAIDDVKETATSFSSANLTPVQTGGQQYSAYVPRFIPHNDQPYEGHLFRFQYFSEFVEGCDVADTTSMKNDLDKDNKCDSVFLLDKPDGYTNLPTPPDPSVYTSQSGYNANIVQENKDGVWIRVATATLDTTTGKLIGGVPAVPFWDAGVVLSQRSASAPCPGNTLPSPTSGRCIFTMIDRNTDGKLDAQDNPPVEFIDTNLAQLQPYLLSGGDAFCNDVFAKLGSVGYTGSAADQTLCAQTVINFVRGVDVFDFDGDNNRTENRPCANDVTKACLLGDIFHSSPVVVDPPVDPFICDVGLHNQCVRTLYMDYAAYGQPPVGEPMCNGANKPNCYKATPMNPPLSRGNSDYGAYSQYVTDSRVGKRPRFILVGANDGMLHAFHTGSATARAKKNALDDVYDLGTGQEMWAFIPPDLLPKLGLMAKGHQYMVDGTPMVRDIWVDGSNNGVPITVTSTPRVKEANEYHTIAILSERSGGNRYVALDVTDPWAMNTAGNSSFRWMWPNIRDPEAAEVGESWQNFAPKPPPIGPVRIENAADPDRGWDEVWITMLNGGYSADLTRGRGVYMVDAWTGQKLWSFVAKPTSVATGDPYTDNVKNRMMPVPAAVAMVDIGVAGSNKNDADGFFDTAMVGDVGGQMWTFRFYKPGQKSSGVVTNWYGARSLEMAREDLSGPGPRKLNVKQPFFNIPSNTLQSETGWIRTFSGTGDRQNLRDTEARGCSPSNLLNCTRLKCDADLTLTASVTGQTITSHITVAAGVLTQDTVTTTGTLGTGNTCDDGQLSMTSFALSCPTTTSLARNAWTAPTLTPGNVCVTSTGPAYSCTAQAADMDSKGDLNPDPAVLSSTVPKNRFFGFYSYGGSDRVFDDLSGALAYDAKRVTDGTFACSSTTGCGLTNVSIPSSARITVTGPDGKPVQVFAPGYNFPKAPTTGPGWYVAYENPDEKTGAGSSVLGGIVFWPSFQTQTVTSGPCVSTAGDQGKSWQADIITGAPDQGESFKVFNAAGTTLLGYQQNKQRTVSAPPPEPANVISISKTGQVRYGISVIEPGSKPSQETLRNKSSASSDVYWLEVPRSLHQCRHVNGQACD